MISDSFVIFMLGMLVILVINYIGYTRIPFLCIIGILGTIFIAADTISGMGDYYAIAFILVLANTVIAFAGLINSQRGM